MKKSHGKLRLVLLALAALSLLSACWWEEGANEDPPPPPPPASTFTVGGTVAGLAGGNIVLQNNLGNDLTVSATGNFTFSTPLASGAAYSVTIRTQPMNPDQVCVVASGSGTIAAANVTDVAVSCSAALPPPPPPPPPPLPPTFTIGGTISGLEGTVVLQKNGGDDLSLGVNGAFTFAGAVDDGTNYIVTVLTQPGSPSQRCTVTNGSGTIAGANVTNVSVSCFRIMTVVSTTPADNAAGVGRFSGITIQFSAAIDPATVTATSITIASVTGAKSYTGAVTGSQVVISPGRSLLPLTQYTLTITTDVRGIQGERLEAPITRTFRTRDGSWGSPRPMIEAATASGYSPVIALGTNGDAMALWGEVEGAESLLTASRYTFEDGWSEPMFLGPDGGQAAPQQVCLDAVGEAFVIWVDRLSPTTVGVYGARFTPGIGWDTESLLGQAASGVYAEIACETLGHVIAVWRQNGVGGVDIRYATHPIGAGWEVSNSLLPDGPVGNGGDVSFPHIARDAEGNAIVTWSDKDGPNYDALARRYTLAAGFGPTELIEDEQATATTFQVAFNADGEAMVVFTQGTANFGPTSIWSNRHVPGDGWQNPELLERDDIAPGFGPSFGFDGSGRAIAIWQQSDLTRSETDIWSNRYLPGTGWGIPVRISTERLGNANMGQVVVDDTGNALAIWKQFDGGTHTNIWVNRYVAGGSWGVAQKLETEPGVAGNPHITIDAEGNAFAIWEQAVGPRVQVFVSRFE